MRPHKQTRFFRLKKKCESILENTLLFTLRKSDLPRFESSPFEKQFAMYAQILPIQNEMYSFVFFVVDYK